MGNATMIGCPRRPGNPCISITKLTISPNQDGPGNYSTEQRICARCGQELLGT